MNMPILTGTMLRNVGEVNVAKQGVMFEIRNKRRLQVVEVNVG